LPQIQKLTTLEMYINTCGGFLLVLIVENVLVGSLHNRGHLTDRNELRALDDLLHAVLLGVWIAAHACAIFYGRAEALLRRLCSSSAATQRDTGRANGTSYKALDA